MKDKIRVLAVCGAMILITGCASTKQYVRFPNQNKAIENPTMARIYVARPTSFGGAISMKVSDGDTVIGKTGPKGYLCWERVPGKITIKGKSENSCQLTLDTEQGESYYVQQHVRFGFFVARNKLSLLSEREGKEKVSKCKPPKQ